MARDTEASPVTGTQNTEVTLTEVTVPDAETVTDQSPERYDFDFEYLASDNGGTKKEDATPTPEVEKTASEEKSESASIKIDIPPIAAKVEGDAIVPSVTKEEPTSQPSDYEKRYKDLQSFHDKSLSERTKEMEVLKSELESLKSFKLAKEEVEKNPLAFVQQYFPELAEQISPQRMIIKKLVEEFGAETIEAYRPEEALIEGSNSSKIHERELELREQLQRSKLDAEFKRREETQKREAIFTESKNRVMKTYGLNEEQFNKEIVEWSKNQPPDLMMIARNRYFDWHVTQAVEQALAGKKKEKVEAPPPSVAGMGGGTSDGEQTSREFKELQDTFGDM